MNVAFSIVLLFILLECVTNEKPPCAKGCHGPLTEFYRPVKALFANLRVFFVGLGNSSEFLSFYIEVSEETYRKIKYLLR